MRISAIAALVVSLFLGSLVQAQTIPDQAEEPRAPQGSAIFGGADARGLAERDGRLDLLLQIFGGYDDDVLAQQGGGIPSAQRLASAAAGLATGFGAALAYSHPGLLFNRPGAKGDFEAYIDSSLRYYPALDNLTGAYHRFGLQLSAPVSRRVTLYANPRADYSPRYAFELFPTTARPAVEGAPPPQGQSAPDIDYSVVANSTFRYGVIGGAEIKVGNHSTLAFDGGITKRTSNVDAFDMNVRNVGVDFDHQFSRTASLNLGYSYQDGLHGTGLATKIHNLDIGVDYRRPLSRTRKTFVSFSTGSTIAESDVSGRRMQVIGSATLTHYMMRTWTATGEYRRRVQYLDGFVEPLFGDAFSASVNGLLTRKVELIMRASHTSGTVGLNVHSPRFESYIMSARLRRALSRQLAGYVEALYYHYDFDEEASRPPGLPRAFNRAAFRGGVSLWIPLKH